jgi:hypothetical protein
VTTAPIETTPLSLASRAYPAIAGSNAPRHRGAENHVHMAVTVPPTLLLRCQEIGGLSQEQLRSLVEPGDWGEIGDRHPSSLYRLVAAGRLAFACETTASRTATVIHNTRNPLDHTDRCLELVKQFTILMFQA